MKQIAHIRFLFVAFFALAAAQSVWAAVIDMGGNTDSTTNLGSYKYNDVAILNNTLTNGTLNVTGNQGFADGTFTFGSGLTLNQTNDRWGIAGGRTVKLMDGAKLNYTSKYDAYIGRLEDGTAYNGTTQLILDNGTVDFSAATILFTPMASNKGSGKNVVLNFTMVNGSSLTTNGKDVKFGQVDRADSKTHTTEKLTVAVTNSTLSVGKIFFGSGNNYLSDQGNSYIHATFGPGADITCKQLYVYSYPKSTIKFDGAVVHTISGVDSYFFGKNSTTFDGYELLSGGLTLNVTNDLNHGQNFAPLFGEGGFTKTGSGTLTYNRDAFKFTGPLTVSNGTFVSSQKMAASAFNVDGASSVLNLSNASLTNATVSLSATDGGTLTLAGATIPNDAAPNLMLAGGGTTDYFTRDSAVSTYSFDSLTLGEGAVLDLDGDATAIDTINATTTNITATSANPATVNLNFSAAPAAGAKFTLFEADSADKFTVVPKLGNVPIPNAVSVVNGVLTLTVTADDYTWNGSQTNWDDAGAWTKNDAAADWSDGNNAVFGTANATAVLAADASAAEVRFTADATISGSSTLTALSVSVVPSVAATISASTAGSLEKTGAGTLTLGASRTDQTTLSEGTLAMSGATVDGTKLTLGTDAAKPVTFDYGGQTFSADLTPALGGYDVSLTNGNFTSTVKLVVADGTLRVKKDSSVSANGHVIVGGTSDTATSTDINALLEIDGGAVTNSAASKHCIIGDYGAEGSVSRMVVKNGGSYYSRQDIVVGNRSTGYLTVDNSTVEAYGYLYFCYDAECLAGENGYVSLTNNGVLAVQKVTYRNGAGNGYFNFDGGTLKATANNQTLLEKKDRLFVNVNAAGGTIDNNGKTITINADLLGAGDMTFTGSGKTTIGDVQTGTGALNVNEGTVEIASGVTLSRAISVASGATLSLAALSTETPVATASSFASGSTLALPAITAKGKYKLFTLSSGTFASDPLASATISGLTVPYTITAEGDTVYLNIAHDYTVVGNTGVSSLTVTDDTVLFGVGGAKLSELAFGATGKLTFDPIKTPIKVSATPTFAEGAKIALSEDYAGMTLGKVVLMTYSGSAAFTQDLFDAASIAPGATFTLTEAAAPDGTSKQLVLTVGDYENEAKEIRILPVGDSITQGVNCSSQGDYPQYRTTIAARLAANGYKPVMKGVWYKSQNDAAGVQQPDEWRWHSGISAERIMIGGTHGGVRDNMHVYLDIAGDVNAITILIGTNDIGSSGRTPEATYAAYTNLVFATAAQRPNAKIFGSTILDRDDKNDSVRNSIAAFNTYLRTDYAAGGLPANYVMLDLYAALPVAESGNFFDKLHPNWKGDAVIGDAFANAVKTALPLTGEGAISGAPDPTVTDEVQTALGAANIPELAEYRSGMMPIFTIDAAAQNGFTSAPYTTINNIVPLNRNVTKVGYYMELIRKGTNRRRYVWVDFDATGKTLGEVDFPWDGANLDFVAEKLHVYSNDPSIHNVVANDNTVTGVVEGTWHNYNGSDDNDGVPVDVIAGKYGWNDTLNTSGNGYGCFQVHRIFNEGEHWNSGEVLFAWNAWGIDKAKSTDEIGIGSFVACESDLASTFSMDYTFTSNSGNGAKDTLTAEAYSVRRVEIWAVPVIPAETQHGKWVGGSGSLSDPVNWDDGQIPVAGDPLDFSGVTGDITINCGDMRETKFGAVTNGTGVITFTGSLKAASFSDTSKVAVGANSTVTLDGDLVFGGTTQQYIIYTVAAGGRFVVTGHIEASSDMNSNGELFPYKKAGAGAIQAKGLVANEGTSDEWRFRLSSDSDGTANWIVGADGLSGSKYFFAMYNSNRKAAIQPLDSDFTIATSIGVRAPLTLNTTGYDGNPHTIKIGDGAGHGGIMRDRPVTITGTGKVVANYDATALHTDHVNSFTVTNTATLVLMPGSNLGTGLVTVNDGATLQVAQSGTVALGGGLTLKDGAALGFNYTTRDAPILDLTGKTVTFDEGATTNVVKISADAGMRPKSGANVLTSGGNFGDATVSLADSSPDWALGVSVNGDGNIVLGVKPLPTIIIIR